MVCKKCGFEAPDGAAFCPQCGARVDGKIACPKCGKYVDEGVVYCMYCGARVDGKSVCPDCGNLLDENAAFCPKCGARADGKKSNVKISEAKISEVKRSTPAPTRVANTSTANKILTIVGDALAGAMLLVVFICMFFTGLGSSVRGADQTSSFVTEAGNIFYFFGDIYKDFGNAFIGASDYTMTAVNFLCAICTIAAAGIIIGVVVFGALAIVRYVRHTVYGKTKDYLPFAVNAYIFYVCGACIIKAVMCVSMNVVGSATAGTMSTKIVFSPATITAIILGAILLGVSVLSRVIRDSNAVFAGRGKAWFVFDVVLVSIGAVVLGVLVLPTSDVSMSDGTGYSVSIGMSGFLWEVALQLVCDGITAQETPVANQVTVEELSSMYNMSLASAIFQLISIIFIAATLAYSIIQLVNRDASGRRGLIFALGACLSILIELILAGLFCGKLYERAVTLQGEPVTSASMSAALIVGMVFTIVMFAAMIAKYLLYPAKNKTIS